MKVGITGGIGSGKTIVCKVFAALGIPVYEADVRAKQLMSSDLIKIQIIEHFGGQAYTGDKLNRDFIADQVFSDFEKRELLNTIVHPAVGKDYEKWCLANSDSPYTIKEAALFFETGSYLEMDEMILVVAELETRIQRVLQRDSFRSKEEVLKIIASQMPDDEKIRQADYVLYNDNSKLLLPEILSIHRELIDNNG